MKILITGFTPFGGEQINPSFEAVKALPDELHGYELVKVEMPTEFIAAQAKLKELLKNGEFAMLFFIGQAGGRKNISVERVALNWIDAPISDNAGIQPVDEEIIKGGEKALFTVLPVKAMVQALREKDIPGELSYFAGTYVCNYLYYLGLVNNRKSCFIHVPFATSQKKEPHLPIDTMTNGLLACLEAVIFEKEVDNKNFGKTH